MHLSVPLFNAAVSASGEQAVLSVLRSGQIANGPKVAEFEVAFSKAIGRPHVVCLSDMTQALAMALRLAGVGVGDEVLTLAFNCLSSTAPIAMVGATPVWIDIDPLHACLDIEDLRAALTRKTKALILYHVAGYPGPAKLVSDFCRANGLTFIEDCNNALGATADQEPVGSRGDYAVFSFYPNRQINALEGAALICPDAETAARAMRLRRFGIDARSFRGPDGEINPSSDIPELSSAASFSHVSASLALEQLSGLEARRLATRHNAQMLEAALQNLNGLRIIRGASGGESAYWALLALAEQRDRLAVALKQSGIQVSRLHQRNDGYSGFGAAPRDLPGTSEFMDQVLAIPCGWWLTRQQVDHVIQVMTRQCQGA